MAGQISALKKLVASSRGQLLVLNFDGNEFIITGTYEQENPDFEPFSILFKEPNLLYVNNAVGDRISVFKLGPDFSGANNLPRLAADGALSKLFFDKPTMVFRIKTFWYSWFLTFNADKTRIVETGNGEWRIWDSSAANGSLRMLQLDTSILHRKPLQALLDPTGRFIVVSFHDDDVLAIIDTKDDHCRLIDSIHIGPRMPDVYTETENYIAFLTSEGTNYLVVARKEKDIVLYRVEYVYGELTYWGDPGDTIRIAEVQNLSAYDGPPEGIALMIEAAKNQRDIYVGVCDTGEETDYILHFAFRTDGGTGRLHYVGKTPSGGRQPVTFQLSKDTEQSFLFISNSKGESGLVALRRDPETGILDQTPAAMMSHAELSAPDGLYNIGEI
ncbi:putative isomerase YbhE [Hypoxylon cercidicola]|nr:putative isomerase YbhE [Hypoxylon cercidicola]